MTLADPLLSVVIPAYNRATIVPRAISSVLAQTYQDWELIVVDDGSKDRTDLAVKAFGDSRIRYLRHSQNRGQSAAQNTGIRAARGKYVAFLDSDDEWLPDKLAGDVKAFGATPGAGMAYSGKRLVDESGRVLLVRMPTLRGRVYEDLLAWDFIGTCSRVTARKDVLDAVHGFDESLVNCQDWDLWVRMAMVAEVAAVDKCVVIRHLGSDHVSGSLRSICDGKMKMIHKHREEMPDGVLGNHLGVASILLMNYEPARARKLAREALALKFFQPRVFCALTASLLGNTTYRTLFSKYASARYGFYVGRAAI